MADKSFFDSALDLGKSAGKKVSGLFTQDVKAQQAQTGVPMSMNFTGSNLIPYNNRENYKVYFVCNDLGVLVDAYLPESFSFDITSEYSTPLSEGLVKSETINLVTKLLGKSTITQEMTAQMWNGNAPIAISLPLVLTAEKDARSEILRKLQQLFRLTLPSKGKGGFLDSPGATVKLKEGKTIAETATGAYDAFVGNNMNLFTENFVINRKVSVYIGRYLYFDSVVIKNVQQTMHTLPGPDGIPLKVEVNVTFETLMTPTFDDVKDIFVDNLADYGD